MGKRAGLKFLEVEVLEVEVLEKQNIIMYKTPDGKTSIAIYSRDGNVWLSQKQMSELFATSRENITIHISNIVQEKELEKDSICKDYLHTATNGKKYKTAYYSLPMILAIGFRVRGIRGTQFRQWANRNLHEYMVKGFILDDERLKNPGESPDYFDEMLKRIRDIRASEKRFYQKLRDLFTLSSDYDQSDKSTQQFFSEVQNKFLFAVTKQTAAEIITTRIDANKQNMGLNTWKGSIVRKEDIYIAKNYLQEDEIDTLNRLVVIFLETAELRAKQHKETTIGFWRNNTDSIIKYNDFNLLQDKGTVSHKIMKEQANQEYQEFDEERKRDEANQDNREDDKALKALEQKIKHRQKKK